jgi:hypothetical protein
LHWRLGPHAGKGDHRTYDDLGRRVCMLSLEAGFLGVELVVRVEHFPEVQCSRS